MNINSSMDQYEKQLYSLFTSYDTARNGNLTKEALHDLCNALQLEDRGKQLIDLLGQDGGEITFQNFRNGLLTVLGEENYDGSVHNMDQNENHSEGDSSGREVSPKFVFGSKKYGRRSRPTYKSESNDFVTDSTLITNNSCDSYNSESVSKSNKTSKIRRSVSLNEGRQINNIDSNSLDSSSCVRNLSFTKLENIECTSNALSKNLDCNRNSDKIFNSALAYDGSLAHELSLVGESMETIANQEIDILSRCSSTEDLISSENIVELWESVGITQPHQLLQDLGFQNRNLKLCQVICVLEEEIKMMVNNLQESFTSHSLLVLFQAVLCLYRCETKSLKLCLGHTVAERNKLKTDLSDANQRTIMLAHEVDENHANMENIMKQNVKQLDLKHMEIVKQLTEEFNSEKELLSTTINKLDKRLLFLESEEVKLKSQVSILQDDNFKLEKELNKSQEELFELRDIKNRLTKELKILGDEHRQKQDTRYQDSDVLELQTKLVRYQQENIALKDKNDELCTELDSLKSQFQNKKAELTEDSCLGNITSQIKHLNNNSESTDSSQESSVMVKFDELQNSSIDNNVLSSDSNVRSIESEQLKDLQPIDFNIVDDKWVSSQRRLKFVISLNDAALECSKKLMKIIRDIGVLSEDALNNNIEPYILLLFIIIKKLTINICNFLHDDQQGKMNLSEVHLSSALRNIVEELLNHRNDIDDSITTTIASDASSMNLNSENNLAKLTEELTSLKSKMSELHNCLKTERREREEEKQRDVDKYQELESNMELLRNEYFKCEEYWSTKINEERELFDQEQRITDEKFAELLTKLSEYEEQYTSQDKKSNRFEGPLSTIEEKCHLEKQFNDLEDEFQEYKTKAENEANIKDGEISELKAKIGKLEESLRDAVNNEKSQQNMQVSSTSNTELSNPNGFMKDQMFQNKIETSMNSEKEINFINSPINYLWNQKTISSPINNSKSSADSQRDYHNPAYKVKDTSEENVNVSSCITPIQKPVSSKLPSTESHLENILKCPIDVKHETKMLNCSELEETLQGRRKHYQQVDGHAKLEPDTQTQKSIMQNQNNSGILKMVALEIHCRQLQTALRQQQIYAENVFQQTVAAHRAEMGALKQRLAAADLLVRDLYVENCHLTRNINNPLLK